MAYRLIDGIRHVTKDGDRLPPDVKRTSRRRRPTTPDIAIPRQLHPGQKVSTVTPRPEGKRSPSSVTVPDPVDEAVRHAAQLVVDHQLLQALAGDEVEDADAGNDVHAGEGGQMTPCRSRSRPARPRASSRTGPCRNGWNPNVCRLRVGQSIM